MKPKSRVLTAFLLAASLFIMPFKAHASGCVEVCAPDSSCMAKCVRIIQNMLVDLDNQVCKNYLKSPGQEMMAASCHNAVEQVAGRMLK